MIENIDFGEGKVVHSGIFPEMGIPFKDQPWPLEQDMLSVVYEGGKYVIDVGCYDHTNFEKLAVSVSVSGDMRKPVFEEEAYTAKKLKESIERAVQAVHKVLNLPDEVSPYSSVLSPRYSKDPVDSLLGRIEVEWEGKESEATAEMVEAVEKEWGVPLPSELKKVVLACNGGGPIPMISTYEGGYQIFHYLYSFNPRDRHHVHEQKVRFSTWLPKDVFPIGKSARGTVCLDYREDPQPQVIAFESDSTPYYIAQNFEDFLTNLQFNIDWGNAKSDTLPSLKNYLDQLEAQWNIEFSLQYKKLVLQAHGGRPDRKFFFYEKGKQRIKRLLRVDEASEENVYHVYKNHFDDTSCYPFAKCPSGAYLCHDYRSGKPSVSLWDPKEDTLYPVKSSFARFLHYLRY
ncbi:SMI1/KNR4 family protein [Kroppenstedtia sanguinis]|uniref:SMI1/KNR4 family protein n=1 Tax=Kroppenstedtia sanguinis TaxID=1380684 RepID=A0ABW4CDC0_9BACL